MSWPTFIDLFSGIGGFRLPLERLGFRCVWSCDNDKYANKIYTKHFGNGGHYPNDIRKVNTKTIPDFDLLCAGFPCQSFSVAGKRKGFQDVRGTLFFEICRIAKAKKPPLLLLENVRGLLSNDKGLTFQIILESLDEVGYWTEWQVLNSKHFGVPQNRQRVFVVGHLAGTGSREVFPVAETSEDLDGTRQKAQGKGPRVRREDNRVAGSLAVGGSGRERNLIANTLNARYHKDGSGNLLIYRHPLNYGKKSVYSQDETYPALRTVQRSPKEPYIQNIPHTFNEGWRKPYPNLRAEGDSAHNELLVDGVKIRRLTPVECERLQGFPDGWTKAVSDTQRYKLLGNAVTTNVVEFLGKHIMERCFS